MVKEYFRNFNGIESVRLVIRKLNIEDIEDIFEFTSQEETCKILSWYPHQDKEITKNFIEGIINKYNNDVPSQWAIELKSEKKVIGIAGFIQYLNEHSKGEIAYVLSPFYQNKGFMTEALS